MKIHGLGARRIITTCVTRIRVCSRSKVRTRAQPNVVKPPPCKHRLAFMYTTVAKPVSGVDQVRTVCTLADN